MDVSIGKHWEVFVEDAVRSGRYGSASEVVLDGLRLLEAREAKLKVLRDTLTAAIAEGGAATDDVLDAELAAVEAELAKAGY